MIIDVFDPGLINIEDQGYPPPLPDAQALPVNLGDLIPGFEFAPPIVPAGSQANPTPTNTDVAQQMGVPLSLSMGVATPATPNIDVGAQNDVRLPVADITVTESGNFQTNETNSFITLTVSAVVDADTGGAPTGSTTRYRVTIAPAVLASLGLSISGRQVVFSGNVTAAITGFVRTVSAFGSNSLIMLVTEYGQSFNTTTPTPQVGDTMIIPTDRQGAQTIYDFQASPLNVYLTQLPPPIAQTLPALPGSFSGNFLPGNGVINPYLGSGVLAPPFIGNFQIANQTYSQGQPTDVYP